MDVIRVNATELEEGMEVETQNSSVLIEQVDLFEGRPYVEFYAFNGRRFRVRNEDRFTVLS